MATNSTIGFLRFPLTVLVVMLHAYTATRNVEWLSEGRPVYLLLTYNLAVIWGNIAVPFFFFISGYLFFRGTGGHPDYLHKWKRRVYSLLIPYVLWNLLTLLLFLVLQQYPPTAGYFSGTIPAIADFTPLDFLRAFWDMGAYDHGNGTPALSPYWYVRNLILLNLAAPGIEKLHRWTKGWWLVVAGGIWLFTPHIAFTACSIFWFGAGAWWGMQDLNPAQAWGRYLREKTIVCGLLWIALNVFVFCRINESAVVVLQRFFVMLSILLIYVYTERKVAGKKEYLPLLAGASFFIYTVHYPLILALRKAMVRCWPGASDAASVALYLLSIVLTVGIAYGLYRLLARCFPRLLAVLCGKYPGTVNKD